MDQHTAPRRTRNSPDQAPSKHASSLESASTMSMGRLITLYCAWKGLLLLLVAASPGLGYDTSTDILLARHASASASSLFHVAEHVVLRLTRWDAIYFASASHRGLTYEQQWAFSPFLAKATSNLTGVFLSSFCASPIVCHALTGIVISHVAHLLSVIVLHRLTYEIIPGGQERKLRVAFTTACLHILSPAGLFLSASYGEASFALTNFWGLYCYVAAHTKTNDLAAAFMFLCSGVAFGTSAMIRSNGLLSGIILAWDALTYLPQLVSILERRALGQLIRLGGVLAGGFFVGVGYVLPQAEAYLQYCTEGNTRPWCDRWLPSIYTWVQDHYWGVGFLRYWTLSNLPLFLIATPMILVLIGTAWIALSGQSIVPMISSTDKQYAKDASLFTRVMARFALPQLVLAVLATTSFHVQIINRISSGYPVWYIVIALAIHGDAATTGKIWASLRSNAQFLVRGAVMYAIVQGGLYASFMPPA